MKVMGTDDQLAGKRKPKVDFRERDKWVEWQ